jgi:hypothetical protein
MHGANTTPHWPQHKCRGHLDVIDLIEPPNRHRVSSSQRTILHHKMGGHAPGIQVTVGPSS